MEVMYNRSDHSGVVYGRRNAENSTINWFPMDTEKLYKEHLSNPKTKELLSRYNWIGKEISYSFNSNCFRSDEFEYSSIRDSVMFLGCSHTMGVGMILEDTWAYCVSKELGLRNYNLGQPGYGMDCCFRLGSYWIPKLLPKIIIMFNPESTRTEMYHKGEWLTLMLSNNVSQKQIQSYYNIWVQEERNHKLQSLRNEYAIKYIAANHQIPIITFTQSELDRARPKDFVHDLARDLAHYGISYNKHITSYVLNKVRSLDKY